MDYIDEDENILIKMNYIDEDILIDKDLLTENDILLENSNNSSNLNIFDKIENENPNKKFLRTISIGNVNDNIWQFSHHPSKVSNEVLESRFMGVVYLTTSIIGSTVIFFPYLAHIIGIFSFLIIFGLGGLIFYIPITIYARCLKNFPNRLTYPEITITILGERYETWIVSLFLTRISFSTILNWIISKLSKLKKSSQGHCNIINK